jgi:Protein of unknown function (DUF2924)
MRQPTEAAAIEAEIARLRSLALDALRRRWRAVFGRTPPAALSKELLGRMIAWRLQEQAFGGLDRESLGFLDGLARHGGSPRRQLKAGTVLVRDYERQRHTVTVMADGFEWQGTTYASLSAIARAITGTVWSGPRFFALRPNGASTRSNNKKSVRGSRDGSHRARPFKNASVFLETASQLCRARAQADVRHAAARDESHGGAASQRRRGRQTSRAPARKRRNCVGAARNNNSSLTQHGLPAHERPC